MTAIQDTYEVIDRHCVEILGIIDDGLDAEFVNGITSVQIIVSGTLYRRHNTLKIMTLGTSRKNGHPRRSNDNALTITCTNPS